MAVGILQGIMWITVGVIFAYHLAVETWRTSTETGSSNILLNSHPGVPKGLSNDSNHSAVMPEGNVNSAGNRSNVSIAEFSWSDCGTPSDPIRINSLFVGPDPLNIPGDCQLSYNITNTVDMTSPFQLNVTMKKLVVFLWVTLPCINGQGSCVYQDFCIYSLKKFYTAFTKPKDPVHCHFTKGEHVSDSTFYLHPSLPSWFLNGKYTVQLTGVATQQLFCVLVKFSVKA